MDPAALGYRMPAEWEPHTQTWMGWPERPDNWRENAQPAQAAFALVVRAIAQFEQVTVCCNPSQLSIAQSTLLPHSNIRVIELPHDDAWFRDIGPTFVVKKGNDGAESVERLLGIDWEFNAWGGTGGGLYPDWERDKAVAKRILSFTGISRVHCPIVLEGGSIHVDGEGTLLTTEECLLHPNRNPQLTKSEIEHHLARMLNIQKFIWLPRGLYGDDDTNGHIDNFACFAKPGLVLLAWTDDCNDPQYERSLEALRVLENSTDAKGRKLEVVKLPLPRPMLSTAEDVRTVQKVHGVKMREEGVRLAGSYVNFYICNGGVIVPGLGDADMDMQAASILAKVFPDRKVVQVPTREILLGGGNIHCITQQQPT